MKTTQLFFLAAAALATTVAVGCKDDKVEFVDCDATPDAEGCQPVLECDKDPGQEGCETYCVENPEADVCKTYCEANPTEEQCLPPVEVRAAKAYSYISAITVPSYTPPAAGEEASEPACCEDLNGDGKIDNNLGRMAWHIDQIFGEEIRATTIFQRAIDSNRLTLVVEYEGLPIDLTETRSVDYTMRVFQAESTSTKEERMAGDGIFTLKGDAGEFTTATIAAGKVDAHADRIAFEFDMAAIGLGAIIDTIVLPFMPAIVSVQVAEDANDPAKIVTTGDGTQYLTGIIPIADLVDIFNDGAEKCDIGEDKLLTFSEAIDEDAEVKKAAITCNYDVAQLEADMAGKDAQCQLLFKVCDSAERILQQYMDQDSNDDGVLDATSFGVEVELVGATIAAE